MSGCDPGEPEGSPPTLLRWVERCCDRFEAAWCAGSRPRIEDEIAAVPEAGRTELLRELLVLELAYRRRAGEGPGPREYRERFRGEERAVDDAFCLPSPDARMADPSAGPFAATGGITWLFGEIAHADDPGPSDRPATCALAPAVDRGEPAATAPCSRHDGDPDADREPVRAETLQGMPTPASRPKTYELAGEIGRGGMGIVMKARDPELGRDLALKVLLEEHRDRSDLVRRFLTEARINGQLQHPGIVPIHDLGALADRRPFFAMKLIEGRTLASCLAERSDPGRDLPRFVGIFSQVCQTVAYAHVRGVIHRDLKPANIMVGAFGEVQVMDWGLAKVLARGPGVADVGGVSQVEPGVPTVLPDGEALSRAGGVLGTPGYMPPEQARGQAERLDERADVFALGAILCEILTSLPAYAGRSSGEVLATARRADLADAYDRLDACSADTELIGLARRCLATQPYDRPRDAGVVADAVTAYLTGVQERLRESELARVEAQTRAAEERKRRRLAVALAGSVLVVCGLTVFGVIESQRRTRQETARIDAAVAKVARLREEARAAWSERLDVLPWQRAEEAAELAVTLLTPRTPASVRQGVRQLVDALNAEGRRARADAALLGELEAARAAASDQEFDAPGAFLRAFEEHGAPMIALKDDAGREALVGRLRRSPGAVTVRLASFIDTWALLLRQRPSRRDQALRLVAVAQSIDPDPWREELRHALGKPRLADQKEALSRLASDGGAVSQGSPTLTLLASALRTVGLPKTAVELLERARFQHPTDPWIHQELGLALRGTRPSRIDDALRAFTAATTLRPELGYELARALHDTGRTTEAIAVLEEVLRRAPNVWYQTRLGEMQAERGMKTAAAESFRRAVAAGRTRVANRPDDAAAYSRLGIALRLSGDVAGAVAACREAVRLDPSLASAYSNLGSALRQARDLRGAAEAHREAIRLDPELATAHVNLGVALLSSQDFPGAASAFRTAIGLRPEWATAHSVLGIALQASGDLPGAIAADREAIRLKPDDAWSHVNLASALIVSKDPVGAIAASREAIRLKPDDSQAYSNLGVALEASKDFAGAIEAHREAVRLRPDFARAHANLGSALREARDLRGAIDAYREAIRLEPGYARAQGALGELLESSGDVRGAIAAFREAIRAQPGLAVAHAKLGTLRLQSGDSAGAVVALREAKRLDPRQAVVCYNLGNALEASGDLPGAIAAYREAIHIQPDYARAYCNLGNAFQSLGRLDEAMTAFKRGHELGLRQPGWAFPSAAWVEQCRRLIERRDGLRKGAPQNRSRPDDSPADELPADLFAP